MERWLSLEEVSDYLGVSKVTLYRLVEKPEFPKHKLGKLWKFRSTEIDEWVVSGAKAQAKAKAKAKKKAAAAAQAAGGPKSGSKAPATKGRKPTARKKSLSSAVSLRG